jgi:hypothetical protein
MKSWQPHTSPKLLQPEKCSSQQLHTDNVRTSAVFVWPHTKQVESSLKTWEWTIPGKIYGLIKDQNG